MTPLTHPIPRRQVCTFMDSPLGRLTLVATDTGLAAVLWENDRPTRVPVQSPVEQEDHPMLSSVRRQLDEYFSGRRRTFAIAFDVDGTGFQKDVWAALRTIPFGETRSYQDIAAQIGRPRAVRAVGAANGRNPVSIITPCHRVIGANGHLTGFAAGLDTKARLLAFEGAAPGTLFG